MEKDSRHVIINNKLRMQIKIKANESTTTYEEAELACLKKLIEIVKNK
jgi:hypothetical protein